MNHTTTNRAIPLIIVLTPNTLSSVGLRLLLESIIPFAIIKICDTVDELASIPAQDIFHIFVSSQILIENIPTFDRLKAKTIALTNGSVNSNALQEYHRINIQQHEASILEEIKALHSVAHGRQHPEAPTKTYDTEPTELLSPREIEVTKLLVEGLINKEVAQRLGIGLTTVITHRKNIFEKLGIRSLAGLTIYALMKRYTEI